MLVSVRKLKSGPYVLIAVAKKGRSYDDQNTHGYHLFIIIRAGHDPISVLVSELQ